jgi:hypothetical protein
LGHRRRELDIAKAWMLRHFAFVSSNFFVLEKMGVSFLL